MPFPKLFLRWGESDVRYPKVDGDPLEGPGLNSSESHGDRPYARPGPSESQVFELRGIGKVEWGWHHKGVWVQGKRLIDCTSASRGKSGDRGISQTRACNLL